MDDFGSGQTSLSYLRRLPITAIKIDRTFVTGLDSSDEAAAIMQALITMARTLGLEITAEGVETAGQLDFLRGCGCDAVQGYLLGRPMPPEELEALRHSLRPS
jgi:EAL domain-containing protein (putative c-di-GMP-specific phosphodiesterase class I)